MSHNEGQQTFAEAGLQDIRASYLRLSSFPRQKSLAGSFAMGPL